MATPNSQQKNQRTHDHFTQQKSLKPRTTQARQCFGCHLGITFVYEGKVPFRKKCDFYSIYSIFAHLFAEKVLFIDQMTAPSKVSTFLTCFDTA